MFQGHFAENVIAEGCRRGELLSLKQHIKKEKESPVFT
jgi:hypothetical protein